MQTQQMSLANIKGKLSRDEMKKIMAGSGSNEACIERGMDCLGRPNDCCESLECAGSDPLVKACTKP